MQSAAVIVQKPYPAPFPGRRFDPRSALTRARPDCGPEEAHALSSRLNKVQATVRLTRRAVQALVKGRHAHIGGRTIPIRAKNLITIASAYSWDELLDEPHIGPATATEIQLWLEEHGSALRNEDPAVVDVTVGHNARCRRDQSGPDRKSPFRTSEKNELAAKP